MIMNTKLFAARLKRARKNIGLTQKGLSDLSGVSTVMISQYERGDISTGKNPSLENTLKIAKVLNVSLDWLCGNINIEENPFFRAYSELPKNRKAQYVQNALDFAEWITTEKENDRPRTPRNGQNENILYLL